MPEEVEEKAIQELKRLESMPPMSAEATVSRNYLDWLIAVPWQKKTKESRDLKRAEEILNEDHYGLEKIKDRILEFLAVRALVKKPKATILTFSGPPGVGKTSLAKSIARAMNRKFVRLSLGGVRDEAEIRGHRRTYIGAFPGQIIQMMKKAGSMNPVFLLDEVDKMSMDFRGDPSAALLEVLDPEQNNAFLDHYLDVEYDLSNVMFICTANVLHTIPQALRDRMEVLQLAGYTEQEKVEIAKKFLAPKAVEGAGLTKDNIMFLDEAFSDDHLSATRAKRASATSSARSRRSAARSRARSSSRARASAWRSRAAKVTEYLGVPRFRPTLAEEKNEIGVATGLAWTEVGGEILTIEATLMPGKGKLTLTGKLGDVMQESAQAAMSYVRSKADEFRIPKNFNRTTDVHIHIPEGAIPKDGPSAGITLATALVSALCRVADPQGRRDDRRDHAARQGPADRRPEGEDPRRAPLGPEDDHRPAREREGPGGHPEERARLARHLHGRVDGRSAEDRAGRAAGRIAAPAAATPGISRRSRITRLRLRLGFEATAPSLRPKPKPFESRQTPEFVTSATDARGIPHDGIPHVALVGRSNVGKSTLLNALTRAQLARTSAAPGKTRLANLYQRGGRRRARAVPGTGASTSRTCRATATRGAGANRSSS